MNISKSTAIQRVYCVP